jgi:hypothetical protein
MEKLIGKPREKVVNLLFQKGYYAIPFEENEKIEKYNKDYVYMAVICDANGIVKEVREI